MNQLIIIIVPVYKVEPYLDRCVQSIVNQTYANLEIILVDDGSPDNCPAMCDAWAEKDSRIRVIHKANEGVAIARNTALSQAKGTYIGFVDGDDYCFPDMYAHLLQNALQQDVDISMSSYYESDVEVCGTNCIRLLWSPVWKCHRFIVRRTCHITILPLSVQI